MSDDLVERVAKAMCKCEGICFTSCGIEPCQMAEENYAKAARAAIAVVLEEAAKVCDGIENKLTEQWKAGYKVCDYTQGTSDGAGDCAAAIRALIKEPT